ncbi:hypothetical protein B0T09DRAFT_349380 [Sordaria sp. MPI-SDFR-AT-0083]|nr:hypothetical protein B0T09DRAFT_349380 [Sordaria sp. MPI-SDFR-AT-0083]
MVSALTLFSPRTGTSCPSVRRPGPTTSRLKVFSADAVAECRTSASDTDIKPSLLALTPGTSSRNTAIQKNEPRSTGFITNSSIDCDETGCLGTCLCWKTSCYYSSHEVVPSSTPGIHCPTSMRRLIYPFDHAPWQTPLFSTSLWLHIELFPMAYSYVIHVVQIIAAPIGVECLILLFSLPLTLLAVVLTPTDRSAARDYSSGPQE